MRTKLVSLEAAARIVRDDSKVVMSSGFAFAPMAMLREIARQGPKNLHEVGVVGGSINLDFLIGAGQVSVLECCGFGFEPFQNVAPNFDRHLKSSTLYSLDNT